MMDHVEEILTANFSKEEQEAMDRAWRGMKKIPLGKKARLLNARREMIRYLCSKTGLQWGELCPIFGPRRHFPALADAILERSRGKSLAAAAKPLIVIIRRSTTGD